MSGVIGMHPGTTVAAPDSYTQWTGAAGILDRLGIMMGGRVADPAPPRSGDPGSPTPGGAQNAGVGPLMDTKTLIVIAGVVAIGVFLLKKF